MSSTTNRPGTTDIGSGNGGANPSSSGTADIGSCTNNNTNRSNETADDNIPPLQLMVDSNHTSSPCRTANDNSSASRNLRSEATATASSRRASTTGASNNNGSCCAHGIFLWSLYPLRKYILRSVVDFVNPVPQQATEPIFPLQERDDDNPVHMVVFRLYAYINDIYLYGKLLPPTTSLSLQILNTVVDNVCNYEF